MRDMRLTTIALTAAVAVPGVAAVPAQAAATRSVASATAAARTTGAPDGPLRHVYPAGGVLRITRPGTVLRGVHVHGLVDVRADNVTIRRSVISGPDRPVRLATDTALLKNTSGARGLTVVASTIRPTHPNVRFNGVNGWNFTLLRVDVSGTVDGVMVFGDHVRIRSSWIHDLTTFANDPNQGGGRSHSDGVQVQGGSDIRIVGSRITGAANAALMVTQDHAAVRDLRFNRNWADGGWCTVNIARKQRAAMTGLQVRGNSFGRRSSLGECAVIFNPAHSDLRPSGNVWAGTTSPAAIRRGA